MPVNSKNFLNDGGFGESVSFPGNMQVNTGARFPKQNVFTDQGDYMQRLPATNRQAGAGRLVRDGSFFFNPNEEEKVGYMPSVESHRISDQTEKMILIGLVMLLGVGVVILLNRK